MQHYCWYKFEAFLCSLQYVFYMQNKKMHLNWGQYPPQLRVNSSRIDTITSTKDDQTKNWFSASMIFHRNHTDKKKEIKLSWKWLRFQLDILCIEGVMNFLLTFLRFLSDKGAHF